MVLVSREKNCVEIFGRRVSHFETKESGNVFWENISETEEKCSMIFQKF
jgi:hypothetical protein